MPTEKKGKIKENPNQVAHFVIDGKLGDNSYGDKYLIATTESFLVFNGYFKL